MMAAGDASPFHEHFGVVIASCERADQHSTSKGVVIHGDDVVRFEAPPSRTPRAEVLDELCARCSMTNRRAVAADGAWR